VALKRASTLRQEGKAKEPFSRPQTEEIKLRTYTSNDLAFLQASITSGRNHLSCS
jgi:hypothetical protein